MQLAGGDAGEALVASHPRCQKCETCWQHSCLFDAATGRHLVLWRQPAAKTDIYLTRIPLETADEGH
jgi:hypothetical protein